MKFVMDERVKHQLTGVVVILSIAVVFLPAMMKKSNRHFEENMSISLKLPAKPVPPVVVIPKQTAMIKSVKVAHVEIAQVAEAQHPAVIAKAESLSQPPKSALVKVEMPLRSVIVAAVAPKKVVAPAETLAQAEAAAVTPSVTKKGFGIQLASFTRESNAKSLVARLRQQGYAANYNIYNGKNGKFYQVVAGLVSKRDDAVNLKNKLATNMQLNGFIVQTGMS